MPACTTPEERVFFRQFILDRIAVVRPGQTYHYHAVSPHASGALMIECVERLAHEGNMHLLGLDELPAAIMQAIPRVQALQSENAELTQRNSRAARLERALRRLIGAARS